MFLIACCRILSYSEPHDIEMCYDGLMWAFVPSIRNGPDARFVNTFDTDEDELQAIGS